MANNTFLTQSDFKRTVHHTDKLRVAAYIRVSTDYDDRVNELMSKPKLKTVDEIAKEVIQGKWSAGDERKQKLTAAGYDYGKVQTRVNELMKNQ